MGKGKKGRSRRREPTVMAQALAVREAVAGTDEESPPVKAGQKYKVFGGIDGEVYCDKVGEGITTLVHRHTERIRVFPQMSLRDLTPQSRSDQINVNPDGFPKMVEYKPLDPQYATWNRKLNSAGIRER